MVTIYTIVQLRFLVTGISELGFQQPLLAIVRAQSMWFVAELPVHADGLVITTRPRHCIPIVASILFSLT